MTGPDPASEGAQLLVVDDEESIRALLETALRFIGFEVVTAANGAEALDAVMRSQPDLIVLDVNLPDLDGFEVCRRIRSDGNDVPVIFLTARDADEDVRAGEIFHICLDAGKIREQLGWVPTVTLEEGVTKTIEWYLKNSNWLKAIQKRQDYQNWIGDNYQKRGKA